MYTLPPYKAVYRLTLIIKTCAKQTLQIQSCFIEVYVTTINPVVGIIVIKNDHTVNTGYFINAQKCNDDIINYKLQEVQCQKITC